MDSKKDVVEKRVKPTVIRRREKPMPPPSEAPRETTPKEAKAQVLAAREAAPSTPIIRVVAPKEKGEEKPIAVQAGAPVIPGLREKEEKAKKGVRRKKSKAELELEDIQRAGGLKQYAQQTVVPEDWEPSVERIFEPTLARGRRKRVLRREFKKTTLTETKTEKKVIPIEKAISVSELSQKMGIRIPEIIKKLMDLGVMATANQSLDVDTATLIAHDYEYEVVHTAFKEEDVLNIPKEGPAENRTVRAPVVTVMGHVDHGKTSLLDMIRKTKVAEGEAGGITQHIGAYEVALPKGTITFIDTPGHEAFTRMRARGAQVTDIVVLVVAADDGIMPQTVEAIDHAKAAQVPIIVAVNKIDKPGADAERVKRGLTEHGLVPEEWGGDVICVPTSAKAGTGIDQLLEMILLTAEVKELKGNFTGDGRGIIIEARLEKGRGPVVTCLVQSGLVQKGDYIVCGKGCGRIRALIQADGTETPQAGPSKPVEILGLDVVPEAGENMMVVSGERDARRIVESRLTSAAAEKSIKPVRLSLDELQKQIAQGEVHEVGLIVKADVMGSAEALVESLKRLSTPEVMVKVLHHGTGGISESDVILAQASKAVVIGFNVTAESKARKLAEQEGIEIRIHTIIYEVLDDIKKTMEGMLKPKTSEKYQGRAAVKQVFKVSKVGMIAGCGVTDGFIRRSSRIRLSRDGKIIFEGKIASLKRFKDDAREVTSGMECGLGIENFNDLKEGDEIEAFEIVTH